MLIFGSEVLLTDGSTRPGPGLSRKVRGLLTENQIRAPASCGMVTILVFPGAPRAMAQLTAKGLPFEEGEAG